MKYIWTIVFILLYFSNDLFFESQQGENNTYSPITEFQILNDTGKRITQIRIVPIHEPTGRFSSVPSGYGINYTRFLFISESDDKLTFRIPSCIRDRYTNIYVDDGNHYTSFNILLSEHCEKTIHTDYYTNDKFTIVIIDIDGIFYSRYNIAISVNEIIVFTQSDICPTFTIINNTNDFLWYFNIYHAASMVITSNNVIGEPHFRDKGNLVTRPIITLPLFYPNDDNRYDIVTHTNSFFSKPNVTITPGSTIELTPNDKIKTFSIDSQNRFRISNVEVFHSGTVIHALRSSTMPMLSDNKTFTLFRTSPNNRYDIRVLGYQTSFSQYDILIHDGDTVLLSTNDIENKIVSILNMTGLKAQIIEFRESNSSDPWSNFQGTSGNNITTNQINVPFTVLKQKANVLWDIRLLSNTGHVFTKPNTDILNIEEIEFIYADLNPDLLTFVLENNTQDDVSVYILHTARRIFTFQGDRPLCHIYAGQTSEIAISNRTADDKYYLTLRSSNNRLTYEKTNIFIQSGDIVTFTIDDCDHEEIIVFYSDFEDDEHGWTIENGNEGNQWHVGSATASTGERSIYISHDNGLTNTYDSSKASTVYIYRSITVPPEAKYSRITQDTRISNGSIGYLFPDSAPVAGILQSRRFFSSSSEWILTTVGYPAGTTNILAFVYHHEGRGNLVQPSVALDNIKLSYYIPKKGKNIIYDDGSISFEVK